MIGLRIRAVNSSNEQCQRHQRQVMHVRAELSEGRGEYVDSARLWAVERCLYSLPRRVPLCRIGSGMRWEAEERPEGSGGRESSDLTRLVPR